MCPFGRVSTIDPFFPPTFAFYLQQNFKIEDEEDLRHDFERLQQAMEMVGFLPATKKQWVKQRNRSRLFALHRNNNKTQIMIVPLPHALEVTCWGLFVLLVITNNIS